MANVCPRGNCVGMKNENLTIISTYVGDKEEQGLLCLPKNILRDIDKNENN